MDITVSILRSGLHWLSLTIDRYSTVLSLKETLWQHCRLPPSQQRIVFSGQILLNELTLDFYNVSNHSNLHFLPAKRSIETTQSVVRKLNGLIENCVSSDRERRKDVVMEIVWLLSDPLLRSSAEIDPWVADVVSRADELVNSIERGKTDRVTCLRARARDQYMHHVDNAPNAVRLMTEMLDSDGGVENTEERQPMRIVPAHRVCERPLPNPWDSGREKNGLYAPALKIKGSPERGSPRKVVVFGSPTKRFAEQIATLRDMGYADDDRIVEALSETNGNVTLAAEKLEDRM
jgi:hypothetical protein